MDERKNPELAKATFATLCKMLDNHEWKYKKDEQKLSVECGAQGDDLPMDIHVEVNLERMLVLLLSHMPFVVQEDRRLDIAVAVCAINNLLVDGSFDYDVTSGHLFFRMSNSIMDSEIGEAALKYLVFCACQTIDEYNDKLLMVAKGMLSIEQFLSLIEN